MKKLGFGLMRLPVTNSEDYSSVDIEKLKVMADLFMKKGYTYYDTAYVYHGGHSETAFREAVVKRYPRDSFTITDKLPIWHLSSKEDVKKTFEESLSRLGVDYIDYYWLHALRAEPYQKALDFDAFNFVRQMKEEGKIKHLGFSFHGTSDVLEKILIEQPDMEIVQLQLNYLDWEDERVQARKNYEICEKYDKKVVIMEPLRGGALVNVPEEVEKLFRSYSSAKITDWGLRFAASHKNVIMVLSGMGTPEQIEQNTAVFDDFVPMNEKELAIVAKAAEFIKKTLAVPCTACHYCDGCPKDIQIPDYFKLYNDYMTSGKKDGARFDAISANHGKPSDCIKCGRCE
ncbi:MAG: aldo/keto reductase, partial [Clostridiales bacterium]|nr:aldo/keto reductase [Clostridiales bacterium]